jgi:hypothetical protein
MGGKIISAAILVASVPFSTASAQPTTLTLACKGTTTVTSMPEEKPEPISMGIIVNFTTKTVQGFGYPGLSDPIVKITAANDVMVVFSGQQEILSSVTRSIEGNIDRVTGDVRATSMSTNRKTDQIVSQTVYTLQCRPAQRIF